MSDTSARALDDEAMLRLDHQLCFAVHTTARAFDRLYRVVLRGTGLTYPQYLTMLVLWEHGDTTVKELGSRLRLDSGTLSPLLKRLEAAGLVRRRRGEHDERSVIVSPTPAGRALKERAGGTPRRILTACAQDVPELADLHDRLLRLTAALDEAAEAAEAVEAQESAPTGPAGAESGA